MIPDFKISFDGNDRTELLRPLLNSIMVVDKPGVEADTIDIVLKMIDSLAVPDSGTDVSVSLGYRDSGVSEVFKGVANRVGLSWPPDRLFIQATGVPLSDDKRMQGSHERAWNEPLTLGEVLRDIFQGAELRLKPVHQTKEAAEMEAHKELDKVKKISRLHLTVPRWFLAVSSPLNVTNFRRIVSERQYQVTKGHIFILLGSSWKKKHTSPTLYPTLVNSVI